MLGNTTASGDNSPRGTTGEFTRTWSNTYAGGHLGSPRNAGSPTKKRVSLSLTPPTAGSPRSSRSSLDGSPPDLPNLVNNTPNFLLPVPNDWEELFEAVDEDDVEEVDRILRPFHSRRILDDIRDSRTAKVKNNSLLAAAARCGSVQVAKYLISQGAKVNLPQTGYPHCPNHGCSALHMAAYAGNLNFCILLRRNGAHIDTKNLSGADPVDMATMMTTRRVRGGAHLHTPVHGAMVAKCLLSFVPENNVDESVLALCQQQMGKDFEEKKVTSSSLKATLRTMIKQDRGALQAQGPRGWSLLHTACAAGNTDAISVLLEYLSDSRMEAGGGIMLRQDDDGWTPFHLLVARCICLPNELSELMPFLTQLSTLTRSCGWIHRVINDSYPMRQWVAQKLWRGRVELKNGTLQEFFLYADPNSRDEERYLAKKGVLISGSTEKSVTVRFFPDNFRRVEIVDLEGRDVFTQSFYCDVSGTKLCPLRHSQLSHAHLQNLMAEKPTHLERRRGGKVASQASNKWAAAVARLKTTITESLRSPSVTLQSQELENNFCDVGPTLCLASQHELAHIWWCMGEARTHQQCEKSVTHHVNVVSPKQGPDIAVNGRNIAVPSKLPEGRSTMHETKSNVSEGTMTPVSPRSPQSPMPQSPTATFNIVVENPFNVATIAVPPAVLPFPAGDGQAPKNKRASVSLRKREKTENKQICVRFVGGKIIRMESEQYEVKYARMSNLQEERTGILEFDRATKIVKLHEVDSLDSLRSSPSGGGSHSMDLSATHKPSTHLIAECSLQDLCVCQNASSNMMCPLAPESNPFSLELGQTPLHWVVENRAHELLCNCIETMESNKASLRLKYASNTAQKIHLMFAWLNCRVQGALACPDTLKILQSNESLKLLINFKEDNFCAEQVTIQPRFDFSFLFLYNEIAIKKHFMEFGVQELKDITSKATNTVQQVVEMKENLRNFLLLLLLKCCAEGATSTLQKLVQVLKLYEEWNGGGLLDAGLKYNFRKHQEKRRDMYAVSVAAKYNRMDILQTLVGLGARISVGGSEALRRAIRMSHYDVAQWIVEHPTASHEPFTCFPSHSAEAPTTRDPVLMISDAEITFCHTHNLLQPHVFENFIATCYRWYRPLITTRQNDADQSVLAAHKAAIMIVGMESRNGGQELVNPILRILKDLEDHVDLIILAREFTGPPNTSVLREDRGSSPGSIFPELQERLQALPSGKFMMLEETFLEDKKSLSLSSHSESVFYDSYGQYVKVQATYNSTQTLTTAAATLAEKNIRNLILLGYTPHLNHRLSRTIADALNLTYNVYLVKEVMPKAVDLIEMQRRGAKVESELEVIRDSIQDTKMQLHSLTLLLGLQSVRYARVFEQFSFVRRLLHQLTDINLGYFHPRMGELYLFLTSLTRHEHGRGALAGYTIQGLYFQPSMLDNDPLHHPMHYLMMYVKFGHNFIEKQNAKDLLLAVIRFLNQTSHTDPSYTFPGHETLVDVAQHIPPPPCVNDHTQCRCIYHLSGPAVHAPLACVVCGRSDRPQEERLSGWKCTACVGAKSSSPQVISSGYLDKVGGVLASCLWNGLENGEETLNQMKEKSVLRPVCPISHRCHEVPRFNINPAGNENTEETKTLQHILHTTPLMLAVSLRLSHIVEEMLLHRPLLAPHQVCGRDDFGRLYRYDEYHDLWGGVINETSVVSQRQKTLPFHFAVMICQLQRVDGTSACPMSTVHSQIGSMPIQSAPSGIGCLPGCSPVFLPGRLPQNSNHSASIRHRRNSISEVRLPPPSPVPKENASDGPGKVEVQLPQQEDMVQAFSPSPWYVPCGLQWICPECGSFLYECRPVDYFYFQVLRGESKHQDTKGREESVKVCRAFIKASTMYKRFCQLGDAHVDSVYVRRGTRGYVIGNTVDFLGLFCRAQYGVQGDTGLSLLFRFVPELAPEVRDLLLHSPWKLYKDVNPLLQDTPGAILLCRRHLWRATRGGVQLLVYDGFLSALQWCALLGDAPLARWVMSMPDFDFKEEMDSCSSRMGYTALHYACYSNSLDVLTLLIEHAKGHLHLLSRPAQASASLREAPERFLLTEQDAEAIRRRFVVDPTADPSAYPQHSRTETGLYGRINPHGETALHVACAFTHSKCFHALLPVASDSLSATTEIDEFTPYDICLAVSHKYEVQRMRSHDGSGQLNEENEELIEMLHQNKVVQDKLRKFGRKRLAFSQTGMFIIYVALLTIYGFIFSNPDGRVVDSMTEVNGNYLAIKALKLELALSPDIHTIDDTIEWIRGPFRQKFLMNQSVVGQRYNIIGNIRVQQLRVNCVNQLCPSKWASSKNNMSAITYHNATFPYAKWSNVYRTDPYSSKSPWTEMLYPVDEGTYFDLVPGLNQSLPMGFLDEYATRLIVLHFTLHSQALREYFVMNLLFEAPETGGIYKTVTYTPVRLDPLHSPSEIFFLLLVFVFYLDNFSWYITVAHSHIMRLRRKLQHTARDGGLIVQCILNALIQHLFPWNIMDLLGLSLLTCMFSVDLIMIQEEARILTEVRGLSTKESSFVSFEYFAYCWRVKKASLAIASLFSWMTTMRSLFYFPHVGPIATAVISLIGSVQVLAFLIIFVIFALAFTISVYWIFGNQLDGYRSFHQSLVRVLTLAFGEDYGEGYNSMGQTSLYTGTFFWLIIITFMNVLLVNTFIAVLNAAYEERLRESQGNWFRKIKTVYLVKSLDFAVVPGTDTLDIAHGHLISRTFFRILAIFVPNEWIKYKAQVDNMIPDYFGDGAPLIDVKKFYYKVLEVPHSGVWMVPGQEHTLFSTKMKRGATAEEQIVTK